MKQTWGIYMRVVSNDCQTLVWWDAAQQRWVPGDNVTKCYRYDDRNLALSSMYVFRANPEVKKMGHPKLRVFTVISNAVAAERAITKERREIQSYINTRVNIVPEAERNALIKLQDWMDEREKKELLDE